MFYSAHADGSLYPRTGCRRQQTRTRDRLPGGLNYMPGDRAFHVRTQRLAGYLIIGIALFARWPLLDAGFSVDDYAQLAMMRGSYPVERAPLALFTFSDGSAHENERLRAVGFFPWWSHPALRVSMFRPLSSALMWFDLRAFGSNAFAYHVHSAFWWLAMMLVLAALLRRVLCGWAAPLALALVAIHPGHILLLGWIANRNAMVATTFALAGLWAQLRASRGAGRRYLLAAAACHILALSASEYAVGFLAYGGCLSLANRPLHASRVARLLPWAGGAVAYVALRAALGFGTRESGMYIDPLREPLAFLLAASQRLPVLVGDLLLGLRSTWWSAGGFPLDAWLVKSGLVGPAWGIELRPLRAIQVSVGVGACALGAIVLQRTLKSSAFDAHPEARALALGFPLALLPSIASLPESRLMLPAMLGWSALLAQALVTELRRRSSAPEQRRSGLPLGLLIVLVECETLLPLASSAGEARDLVKVTEEVRSAMLTPQIDAVSGPGQHVLLVSAIDPTTTIYLPLARSWYGHAGPDSCQLLMSGYGLLRLKRVAARSFELERLQHEFSALDVYASAFNRLPLRRGERFRSGILATEILRTHAGRPMHVRYELDRSLDSQSIVLLTQTPRGLQRRGFPAIGASQIIEPAALPRELPPAAR